MALDIAAGILIAGIISGIFSLGAWMFAQGLDEGIRSLIIGGTILAVVALSAALALIADRVPAFGDVIGMVIAAFITGPLLHRN